MTQRNEAKRNALRTRRPRTSACNRSTPLRTRCIATYLSFERFVSRCHRRSLFKHTCEWSRESRRSARAPRRSAPAALVARDYCIDVGLIRNNTQSQVVYLERATDGMKTTSRRPSSCTSATPRPVSNADTRSPANTCANASAVRDKSPHTLHFRANVARTFELQSAIKRYCAG